MTDIPKIEANCSYCGSLLTVSHVKFKEDGTLSFDVDECIVCSNHNIEDVEEDLFDDIYNDDELLEELLKYAE